MPAVIIERAATLKGTVARRQSAGYGGDLNLRFSGPYAWVGASDAPSLFDADVRTSAGIYLWTIPLSDGR